jgi:hypothetical protein
MTHFTSRTQTYYCDAPDDKTVFQCPNSFEGEGNAREVWADARHQGWRVVHGKHFCPGHSKSASALSVGEENDEG